MTIFLEQVNFAAISDSLKFSFIPDTIVRV